AAASRPAPLQRAVGLEGTKPLARWARTQPLDRHHGDGGRRGPDAVPRQAPHRPRRSRAGGGWRRLRLLPARSLRAALVRVLGPRRLRRGVALTAGVARPLARCRAPSGVRARPRDPRPAPRPSLPAVAAA